MMFSKNFFLPRLPDIALISCKLGEDERLLKGMTNFTKIKGIGDWTVRYVAMRGLGMVDSFPTNSIYEGMIYSIVGIASWYNDVQVKLVDLKN